MSDPIRKPKPTMKEIPMTTTPATTAMPESLTVSGVVYVREDMVTGGVTGTHHVIVVAAHGWIVIGDAVDPTADRITLTGASVVRRWTNGRGLGALADPGYRDEYTLDPVGTITVHAVVAVIECRW